MFKTLSLNQTNSFTELIISRLWW